MRVLLQHGDPPDTLIWTGEVEWPCAPREGDRVRVPGEGPGGNVLTVSAVLFESDGSVMIVMREGGDALHKELADHPGWTTP
jgi:hypothetical protein